MPTPRSAKSHARRTSPTYYSWTAMRARCGYAKHPAFANYGGRGIKVCPRWQNSFENFVADMGERPHGKTLDRFPNKDGHYEPGNCRWATAKQQTHNRRCSITTLREFVPPVDLSGKNFGLLTAVRFSHSSTRRVAYWHCVCACGNECTVRRDNLIARNVGSCGCVRRPYVRIAKAVRS